MRLALAGALALGGLAAGADEDEKLAARVAKIDPLFQKSLSDLAKKYDAEKDPEAAHFFAECTLGFGLKDQKISVIKGAYEIDLYVGKLRGGVVLKAVNPIKRELEGLAKDYKKIYDELILASRGGPMARARDLSWIPQIERPHEGSAWPPTSNPPRGDSERGGRGGLEIAACCYYNGGVVWRLMTMPLACRCTTGGGRGRLLSSDK